MKQRGEIAKVPEYEANEAKEVKGFPTGADT